MCHVLTRTCSDLGMCMSSFLHACVFACVCLLVCWKDVRCIQTCVHIWCFFSGFSSLFSWQNVGNNNSTNVKPQTTNNKQQTNNSSIPGVFHLVPGTKWRRVHSPVSVTRERLACFMTVGSKPTTSASHSSSSANPEMGNCFRPENNTNVALGNKVHVVKWLL